MAIGNSSGAPCICRYQMRDENGAGDCVPSAVVLLVTHDAHVALLTILSLSGVAHMESKTKPPSSQPALPSHDVDGPRSCLCANHHYGID